MAEDGDLVAARYAFGGATIAREKLATPVKVFAVMPKTFSVEGVMAGRARSSPPTLDVESRVKVVDRRAKEGDHVNLDAAPLIVGVGRGFNAREDLALGDELAGALGAVVGCTKSLADFEWLGEDRVIGLSGAKTAPDLYVAVGVSGQIQHTVGVAGAKLIAAVNKDKEAPIFAMADYGLVGDLYEVVPALVERLRPCDASVRRRGHHQWRGSRRLARRTFELLRRRETAPSERPGRGHSRGPGPLHLAPSPRRLVVVEPRHLDHDRHSSHVVRRNLAS